jgi:3-dehydroquinate dehydratase-2
MLGKRDPLLYGTEHFDKILEWLRGLYPELEIGYYQSNSEGMMIDKIQLMESEGYQGLIINPGGYSHYSISILDALTLLHIPRLEVHLSPIHSREDIRRVSLTASGCHGLISGLGKESYRLALDWMRNYGARPAGFQIGRTN